MNFPIPLLIAGIAGAYFLNKNSKGTYFNTTSTNKKDYPSLILTTKFPGYEIKTNKFVISDKSQALDFVRQQGVNRINSLFIRANKNPDDIFSIDFYMRYPCSDLFGIKTNDWDTKDLYDTKLNSMTTYFNGPMLITNKFKTYFKNNAQIMTEFYLNYCAAIIATLGDLMINYPNVQSFLIGTSESLINEWNNFVKESGFNNKITVNDLNKVIESI